MVLFAEWWERELEPIFDTTVKMCDFLEIFLFVVLYIVHSRYSPLQPLTATDPRAGGWGWRGGSGARQIPTGS
jgi:hypothetical protein